MAVIFSSKQFKDVFTDPVTADAAATKANEEVDRRGTVMYGRVTDQGYRDFSTEKKPGDTHKVITVGTNPLAYFDEEDDGELLRPSSDDVEIYELRKYVRALEARMKQAGISYEK